MKKLSDIHGLSLAVLFSLSAVLSAQSVETAFTSMPDEYYLSLSQSMRADMLKAYHAGDTLGVHNLLGGSSRIDSLDASADWLRVRNSDNGYVELKVTKDVRGSKMFVLVFTACASACSSHVGAFNSDWSLCRNKVIDEVSVADFLDKEKILADGESLERIVSLIDIPLISYSYSDASHSRLYASLESLKALDADSRKRVEKYVRTYALPVKTIGLNP